MGYPGEVTIRPAGPEDVGVLAELRRRRAAEQVAEPHEDPGFHDAFAAWFDRERDARLAWLAHVDDEPAGMVNMLVFTRMPKPQHPDRRTAPGQWGYVANAYVAPAYRNHGVGGALLDAAVDHARKRRFARLVLSPSPRSVSFYARAGFEPATSLMTLQLD